MAAVKTARPQTPRRQRSLAEKRHLVELTLRPGASARAVALEHGVHQNTLGVWKKAYRAGKLGAERTTARDGAAQSTSFVPVDVASTPRKRVDTGRGVVDVVFPSGATLRVETGALDRALVIALVAELRR